MLATTAAALLLALPRTLLVTAVLAALVLTTLSLMAGELTLFVALLTLDGVASAA